MDGLRYYYHCIKRTLHEVSSSYGINSATQIINTSFTIIPFVILAIVLSAQHGFTRQVLDISRTYFSLLFGFVWFFVVLLFNLIRSPLLLKRDSDQKITGLENAIHTLNQRLLPQLSFELENTSTFIQRTAGLTLLRICVRNLSKVENLRNVTVLLDEVKPKGVSFLPLVLHQMHDNQPPATVFKQSFDLSPLRPHFIDVVSVVNQDGSFAFYIEHAVWNLPKERVNSITSLKLSAYADNSPSITEVFAIMTENGQPILVRADKLPTVG